ncbi:MAG: chromosome segregation SMC family protein, partial [Planctomycetota bacterium]
MQLASQELFGFKSFANRSRFDFGSGVTIIVGPNGCGKSNVVDSIKWVLGEQSAKSLRGHEMMDVIFNGSKNRKALGFAETTLTFRGCKGRIHPELDEISVTRKLFRSGDSEYQINRKPCRLKDIRELFMDTGVGMKAYSIIEQGKIDALLQASGHERRAIFDEAAGISKYKARKKETQRRLERTDQNLTIIDTTLEEVGKRLRSLKIQAGRARRFIEYRGELRKYRIAQALHKYHGYRQEQVRISGELVLAEGERERLSADMGSREAELSLLEDTLHDQEEKHRDAVAESQRLDQQLTSDRERKVGLKEHLEDLGREEIRLQGFMTECKKQIEKGREELAVAAEQLKAEEEEEQGLAARIREAEEKLAAFGLELEGISESMHRLKGEGVDNEVAQAQERSRAGEIEEDLARLGKERAGVEASHRELSTQAEQAEG